MSNIVRFPTQQARDWAAIERVLSQILDEANIHQEAKSLLLARMKAFTELLQMQFEFSLPSNCPAEVKRELDRFSVALHERSNSLLMERLYREVEGLRTSGLL